MWVMNCYARRGVGHTTTDGGRKDKVICGCAPKIALHLFKEVKDQKKGDYFGEFNLGSTIVLIFEAPEGFEFDLKPFQPVRVGNPIEAVKSTSES